MYQLKVTTKSGNFTFDKVEEFISGMKYFFLRQKSGETRSINRLDLVSVEQRKSKKDDFKIVRLKKIHQKS